ncbi:DUF445 domain-containing protein [Peribacillus sp. SCS-155]|uniref:DUF445 domain-containing protein n=1 Tax=Peribacillus sedimenti TaxID=3115297 RepID=UPI0039060A38
MQNNSQPNKSKHLASISLAIMGAGFLSTIPFKGPALEILQGGFEAGLVGGLADWFAVTALFRQPLGLPIPHTALLPKNRKRMTTALVSTIENEWLSVESIKEKIKNMRILEKIMPAVEKEIQSESFKRGVMITCSSAVRHLKLERLAPYVERKLRAYIASVPIERLLTAAGRQAVEKGFYEKAFDALLLKAEEWLMMPHRKEQIGGFALNAINKIEADGILQFALKSLQNLVNEEKLGKILQNLLINYIYSMRYEKDQNRQAILAYIKNQFINIGDNKQVTAAISRMLEEFLSSWQPNQRIVEVLDNLQKEAITFIEDEKFVDQYFLPFVTELLNAAKNDKAKIEKAEAWLQQQIAELIENNHKKIGKLVEENLDKLDNETLIDMVENNVGKDLQWIRVNGAVCGFMIGIILSSFKAII